MCEESDQRIRLVVLGGGGVGKTAIIKRFLFNAFDDKYRSTVEDLYYREYDIGSVTIKVDILDTAGDLQFPAMRRLSIATAGAFLLVYSVDCDTSLRILQQCFDEIREHRADFSDIPIVIVGNKTDVEDRKIAKEDAAEWVYCELPRIKVKLLECSARAGVGVSDVFRAFLQLAKLTPASEDSGGLRRRSSAYGSLRADSSRLSPRRESISETSSDAGGASKFKPRSRSLIRRSSRKPAGGKMRESTANSTPHDECNVS